MWWLLIVVLGAMRQWKHQIERIHNCGTTQVFFLMIFPHVSPRTLIFWETEHLIRKKVCCSFNPLSEWSERFFEDLLLIPPLFAPMPSPLTIFARLSQTLKIIPEGHYIPSATPKGSARTSLGPTSQAWPELGTAQVSTKSA